jgi:hypothetical protein
VEGLWSPSLVHGRKKRMQKPERIADAHFVLVRRSLSPSGGASIQSYVFFKLSITSCSCRSIAFRNDEGDPVGSPSTGSECG